VAGTRLETTAPFLGKPASHEVVMPTIRREPNRSREWIRRQ
jgi:hypothetical protein